MKQKFKYRLIGILISVSLVILAWYVDQHTYLSYTQEKSSIQSWFFIYLILLIVPFAYIWLTAARRFFLKEKEEKKTSNKGMYAMCIVYIIILINVLYKVYKWWLPY